MEPSRRHGMTKIFIFDDYEISVTDPEDIDFQNAFYEQTYRALYERIAAP